MAAIAGAGAGVVVVAVFLIYRRCMKASRASTTPEALVVPNPARQEEMLPVPVTVALVYDPFTRK